MRTSSSNNGIQPPLLSRLFLLFFSCTFQIKTLSFPIFRQPSRPSPAQRLHGLSFAAALGGCRHKRRQSSTQIQPQTMAETSAILLCVERLDPNLQALEQFLMHDDNDPPPLPPPPINTPMLQSPVTGSEIMHPGDPIMETFIDNEMFQEGFQTNPSTVHGETSIISSDFGNPIQLSSWPLQLPPYTCSCCQTLREITHTNGVEITKLEIHGRLGVICHAVLEKYNIDLTTNLSHEYKLFDFCKESIRRVKQFLAEYCMERKLNAYIMLQDPLSPFYEAVCVGLDWEDRTDDLIHQDSGDHHNPLPYVGSSRSTTSVNYKTTLSIQRERTGKLTIRDLVGYFHLPIEVAAKQIQICPTVIKKICRKHGLSRWPYRKIKSIQKKISMRARHLTSMEAEERGRVQAKIDTLQQEISDIYSWISV